MARENVIISGGSRGIGKAIAQVLEDTGYKVFAPSSKEMDVACSESIENYINKNIQGEIYGLIANAGIYYESTIQNHPLDKWQEVIDINLTGSFRLIQTALKKLAKPSRIILISSVSAEGDAGAAAYAASKAGMIAMMKSIAPELTVQGININAICPGWVRTDMANSIIENQEQEKAYLAASLLNRWIEPEEIANLAKYLLSEEAAAITAETIKIDAGLTA